MKIRVITTYTTDVEQTWEVPDNTDIDEVLGLGLPAEAELIGETEVLGNDYYGEITKIEVIED
jgi:hypothetical protein